MPLFIAHAVTAQHFADGGSPLDFRSVSAHSSKELKARYAALSSVDSQPFDGDSLSEEEKLKNLGD